MEKQHIGFLHPGAMGISLAATAKNSGHIPYWVSENRSSETAKRAAHVGLTEVPTFQELGNACSVIISVCPPHAATEVAKEVLATSFKGIYADVNAISPEKSRIIGQIMEDAKVSYVDGGIVGGPAWQPNTTWLYLSGEKSQHIAECFASGPLETELLGDEIGKASALKMCFAANSKGTTALLCAVVAAAEKMGVREQLQKQWTRYNPGFTKDTLDRITRVAAKAWRFSGEMEEIANTLDEAGIPDGFHLAASDIYRRIEKFKDGVQPPPPEDLLNALIHPKKDS